MKKYFFTLIFIFGLFFLGFAPDLVSADETMPMETEISQADPYDNRVINIKVSNYHFYTDILRVTELRVCETGEEGCEEYPQAVNADRDLSTTPMKVVGDEANYNVPSNSNLAPQTITYTIQTQTDGEIYILVRCYQESGLLIPATNASVFTIYKLSTLNQRIVINPDASNKPTYTYDNIQYTAARNNRVNIELFENEFEEFTGEVYVCEYYLEENHKCLKYSVSEDIFNYYIESYGDGEKNLNFYLVKKDKVISNLEFTDANSTLISKRIILDTVGPKISIEGGQWIFVESGKKYTEQKATCQDAVFPDDECSVTNDLKVVRIDYASNKYQLVTYEATDRLGNTSSLAVKVKVEIIVKDNSTLIAIIGGAVILLATISILGVVVYKNSQKKKKLSYI